MYHVCVSQEYLREVHVTDFIPIAYSTINYTCLDYGSHAYLREILDGRRNEALR
jgi:hypothetical protein